MARTAKTGADTAPATNPRTRRMGRPRKQVAGDDKSSRDKLLDAAITLFASRGYEGVSTGQVAAAAGLTQSMVHYHFQSKSKLWKAAIDKMMRDRGTLLPASPSDLRDLDPLSRLKVLIRRFIAISAAHPELARIAVQEGMTRSARLRWLVAKYVGTTYRSFDEAIAEAHAQKLIRDLPKHEITNIILIAASIPFTLTAWMDEIYRIRMDDPEEIDVHSDTLMKIIFEGLQAR